MTRADELIAGVGVMLCLFAFVTSPAAPEYVRTVESLALGRCPGCGYRWATGRHQSPWMGHA